MGTLNKDVSKDDNADHDIGNHMDQDVENEKKPSRDQWSKPIEFLLSCMASSVGLGNLWRFPLVAYENGGGAFLYLYILVVIFISKPLYYMEMCMGQFSSSGSVKAWNLAPAFRGIGYGQALASFSVLTYYTPLMAITIYYTIVSFQSQLPWSVCGEWAQIPNVTCAEPYQNITDVTGDVISSSEAYFKHEVVKQDLSGWFSTIGVPEWRLAICLLFSWLILFLGQFKGVKVSGKVAYITSLFPYLGLFILLIKGLTLEGALKGVMYFLTPQWNKLLEAKVYYAAVTQSFFSLTIGYGATTMFSSYNGFRHNINRDATIVSVTDTINSVLAGMTVFAIHGHSAHKLGKPIGDVVIGGTGLAFIKYPEILATFTVSTHFFAVIFFLTLFTLAVGSSSSLILSIVTVICEDFPHFKRWVVTGIVCLLGFLLGLFFITPQGLVFLTLIDYYGGNLIIYVLIIVEVIAVQWIYGVNNFCRDIEFMLNRITGYYLKFCWAILIPVTMIIIFSYKMSHDSQLLHDDIELGTGANAFGAFLVVIACVMVPIFFCYEVRKRTSSTANQISLKEAIKETFNPTEIWGPKDPVLKREYMDQLEDNKSTGWLMSKLSGCFGPRN